MQIPGLIIGLGKTGVHIAGLVSTMWSQVFGQDPDHLSLLGIGFEDAPADFPNNAYVKLDQHANDAIARTRQQPLPWYETPEHPTTFGANALLPRVLERLIFAQDIVRGDESRLFRMLTQRTNSSILRTDSTVIIIADLGEPIGSTLPIDMANFVRYQLKQINILEPTIIGYTIFSKTHPTRVYAATRELSRLNTVVDVDFKYPIDYKTPDGTQNIWNQKIDRAPLDLWNVFDLDENTAFSIAASVFCRLTITKRIAADQVNLNSIETVQGGNTGVATIGTENAYTLVMPAHYIKQQWETDLITAQLHDTLTVDMPDDFISDLVNNNPLMEALFTTWSDEKSYIFSPTSRLKVHERVDRATNLIFSAPHFYEGDLRELRTDTFSTDIANNANAHCDRATQIEKRLQIFNASMLDNSPFVSLLKTALKRHAQLFKAELTRYINEMPHTSSNLQGILTLLDKLSGNIAAVKQWHAAEQANLSKYDKPLADEKAQYDKLNPEIKKLCQGVGNGFNPMRLIRPTDPRLIAVSNALMNSALNILNISRYKLMVDGLVAYYDEIGQVVQSIMRDARQWYSTLDSLGASIEASSAMDAILPKNDHVHYAPTSLDEHAWLAETRQSILSTVHSWFKWSVDDNANLTLAIVDNKHDERPKVAYANDAHLEQSVEERLFTIAAALFSGAHETHTLPHYLQYESQQGNLSIEPTIVEESQVAEAESLQLGFRFANSVRTAKGYVLEPSFNQANLDNFSSITKKIKERKNTTMADETRVARILHPHTQLFAYISSTQLINLGTEVDTYQMLRNTYYRGVNPQEHLFKSEQIALALEKELREQDSTFILSDEVVHILRSEDDWMWFGIAHAISANRKDMSDELNFVRANYRDKADLIAAIKGYIRGADTYTPYTQSIFKRLVPGMGMQMLQSIRYDDTNQASMLATYFDELPTLPVSKATRGDLMVYLRECILLTLCYDWLNANRLDYESREDMATHAEVYTILYTLVRRMERQKRDHINSYFSNTSDLTW